MQIRRGKKENLKVYYLLEKHPKAPYGFCIEILGSGQYSTQPRSNKRLNLRNTPHREEHVLSSQMFSSL
jgi:hypothetical protein